MKHEIKTYIRDDETVVETYIFEDGVTLSYEPENADCGVNVYGRYAFIWCDYHEFRFDGTTYTMRRLPDNEFVEVPNPGFHAACRVLKLWFDEFTELYPA